VPLFQAITLVFTGPKTVKLFSNKEHMGFRYTFSRHVQTFQNTLSFSLKADHDFLCLNGSNVNDYPPSDSLDLSSNHLAEVHWFPANHSTVNYFMMTI
jgi:hypothetical protein